MEIRAAGDEPSLVLFDYVEYTFESDEEQANSVTSQTTEASSTAKISPTTKTSPTAEISPTTETTPSPGLQRSDTTSSKLSVAKISGVVSSVVVAVVIVLYILVKYRRLGRQPLSSNNSLFTPGSHSMYVEITTSD